MSNEVERLAEQAVEGAHAELWRRFIEPRHGILYDYSSPTGEVLLPTPAECAESRPNALGWWTPIENGAFFGGLYLAALVARWRVRGEAATVVEARRIAGGLAHLARVGQTPGFIARGVGSDGRCHYLAGSDDQTLPWFYGLWRYLRSDLPTAAERLELSGLMARVGSALRAADWRLPCDRAELGTRGSFTGASCLDSARLLFVTRALHEVTGEAAWLEEYRRRRDETPAGGKLTRLEWCARGAEYGPPGSRSGHPTNPPFWTSVSSQACLAALAELEPAEAAFGQGLAVNAATALPHLERARRYDPDDESAFDINWRRLNDLWRPQTRIDEAVEVALQEVLAWNHQAPRRGVENETVREPLCAAWLVALAGPDQAALARATLAPLLPRYRWERLYMATFFAVEGAWYEGR